MVDQIKEFEVTVLLPLQKKVQMLQEVVEPLAAKTHEESNPARAVSGEANEDRSLDMGNIVEAKVEDAIERSIAARMVEHTTPLQQQLETMASKMINLPTKDVTDSLQQKVAVVENSLQQLEPGMNSRLEQL